MRSTSSKATGVESVGAIKATSFRYVQNNCQGNTPNLRGSRVLSIEVTMVQ
ncbi:MAG: hypothetical protein VYD51_06040 [Bacteroidota bacterium]|nr:hypothetical protein [Bacteroidota bacterium]